MTEFISPATRFIGLPSPFKMNRGGVLHGARLAYETWGQPNAGRDNVLLIFTGLSPGAHAASNPDDMSPGWWELMLGQDKPIDTRHWHVICVNSLGGCNGSTGPASLNPSTGEPYRLKFPELSIEDIADAAAFAVRAMGFDRLACVIGSSMGGMSALAFLARHPGLAQSHINISGAMQALPFSIAIRSLQREAIRLDPNWNQGHYDETSYPESGMSTARKLGVITYRSALEWEGRFGRVRLDADSRFDEDPFGLEFEVEGYLEGHARRFVRDFDPNCYLYLSRSMDWFDLSESGYASTDHYLPKIQLESALTIGVSSDILFPLQQQLKISESLLHSGVDARFVPLDSPQGHDAFLVDVARFGPVIAGFLQERSPSGSTYSPFSMPAFQHDQFENARSAEAPLGYISSKVNVRGTNRSTVF